MKTRMKIYTILLILAALFIASQAMAESAEMPVTVTIINCVDYPEDERCIRLNEIEPAAGVAEWTPEEQDMEHKE